MWVPPVEKCCTIWPKVCLNLQHCGGGLQSSQDPERDSEWPGHITHSLQLYEVLGLNQVAEVFTICKQMGWSKGYSNCSTLVVLGNEEPCQVRPQIDKAAAIAACLRPKTKKVIRQFSSWILLKVCIYFWMLPALCLISLRRECQILVQWMESCEQAFCKVKAVNSPDLLIFGLSFGLFINLQKLKLKSICRRNKENNKKKHKVAWNVTWLLWWRWTPVVKVDTFTHQI